VEPSFKMCIIYISPAIIINFMSTYFQIQQA